MSPKPRVTRTLNPLQFEALEPHRFEDLVRRLLYGFRDWIELDPTGRGGGDDGFDIRAREKGESVVNSSDEGEEGERTGSGRLWQIQCKREKTITPARIAEIVAGDIDAENPPHGYILAAATNISKAAYDVFRDELRKKGVQESYFWGKDYLEDQLALPQNDEILFTFFGISLSPRRKSRTAEIKFGLNNKNKMLRLLVDKDATLSAHQMSPRAMLLRDVNDTFYPHEHEYEDWASRRRWEEHDAVHMTPRGIYFQRREFYAYVDPVKQEWDYSKYVDLAPRRHNIDAANERRLNNDGKNAEYVWRHMPRRFQAKLVVYGFVAFEDMLVIDERGDPEYDVPHIFVEFGQPRGPFSFTKGNLMQNNDVLGGDEFIQTLKRIDRFPSEFVKVGRGVTRTSESLGVSHEQIQDMSWNKKLYGLDGELSDLGENDVIEVKSTDRGAQGDVKHFEVTHSYEVTVAELTGERDQSYWHSTLKKWAGRDVVDSDKVTVYEVAELYTWAKEERHYASER